MLRTLLANETDTAGDHRVIAKLPEEWPEEVDADESGLETFGEQKRCSLTTIPFTLNTNITNHSDTSSFKPALSP